MPRNQVTLNDIYDVVNRLEDKMDDRFTSMQKEIDETTTKVDQVMGKIGVMVAIVTLIISATISFFFDSFKKLIARV